MASAHSVETVFHPLAVGVDHNDYELNLKHATASDGFGEQCLLSTLKMVSRFVSDGFAGDVRLPSNGYLTRPQEVIIAACLFSPLPSLAMKYGFTRSRYLSQFISELNGSSLPMPGITEWVHRPTTAVAAAHHCDASTFLSPHVVFQLDSLQPVLLAPGSARANNRSPRVQLLLCFSHASRAVWASITCPFVLQLENNSLIIVVI